MEEVELTTRRLAKIWWALIFRLIAGSVLLVILLFLLNSAVALFGLAMQGPVRIADLALGIIGQFGVLYLALTGILEARYPEFRIALVRDQISK